jgi:methylmalonyl-CoA epimerase
MKVGSKDFPLAHLAIAVSSIDKSAKTYVALGFTPERPENIARERVRVQLVYKGELRIELLEAYPAGEGPIAKFIQKRGPGIHHMALHSDALDSDLVLLLKTGIAPLPGYPATGAGGSRVAFLDPKTTGGVLIELVEPQPLKRI